MSERDRYRSTIGRALALAAALIGTVLLILHFAVSSPGWGLPLPFAIWRFLAYMTMLTNIGLVLALLAGGLPQVRFLSFFRRPLVRAALAGYILVVAVYYHFFILPKADLGGLRLWPELGLHYLMPALYLVWLLAFTERAALPWRAAFGLLVPPALYLVWVLARGAVVGQYPYDVVDVTRIGYGGVALAALAFVFIFLAFNALGIALVGVARRGRPAGAAV